MPGKRNHFDDHQENLCNAVLSIISLRNFVFLTKVIFIQEAFRNIQGLL